MGTHKPGANHKSSLTSWRPPMYRIPESVPRETLITRHTSDISFATRLFADMPAIFLIENSLRPHILHVSMCASNFRGENWDFPIAYCIIYRNKILTHKYARTPAQEIIMRRERRGRLSVNNMARLMLVRVVIL